MRYGHYVRRLADLRPHMGTTSDTRTVRVLTCTFRKVLLTIIIDKPTLGVK